MVQVKCTQSNIIVGENTRPRRIECLTAKYVPPIITTTKVKHVDASDVVVLAKRQFLI